MVHCESSSALPWLLWLQRSVYTENENRLWLSRSSSWRTVVILVLYLPQSSKGLQTLLMTETVGLDGIIIVINRVLPWRLRQRTWRFEFRQTSSNDTSAATSESCYKQQDTFHTLLCHGDVSPVQMLWHDNVTLFVKVRQQSDFWREDFFIQPIWFGPIWQLDLSEWQMKSAWQTKQVFVMRISLLFLNF